LRFSVKRLIADIEELYGLLLQARGITTAQDAL